VFGSIFLGVFGGLLGSLFITINTQMGYCRKKVIKNNCMRIVECGLYGVATITVMSIIVISLTECDKIPPCIDCINPARTKNYNDEID
jgi:H+/Cl- antiporter ClcA